MYLDITGVYDPGLYRRVDVEFEDIPVENNHYKRTFVNDPVWRREKYTNTNTLWGAFLYLDGKLMLEYEFKRPIVMFAHDITISIVPNPGGVMNNEITPKVKC